VQRQEAEQEMQKRVQKTQAEKQALVERVSSLSRTLSDIENEKREAERSSVRLEKDKNALRKTLDKVCCTSFYLKNNGNGFFLW
jgi:rootletin